MDISLHPHAQERAQERGASLEEVVETVRHGEQFPAKFGRTVFRRSLVFAGEWRGKWYNCKQVEAIATECELQWLVITVIVRFYS